MWKLTIEDDEGATREVDLVREGYTVGRDGTCDVFLPERNVSRRHARLERSAEGRWWLVDLGAPYGSFVNGLRVEGKVALSPGDVVRVGDFWLGLAEGEATGDDVAAGPAGGRTPLPWDVRNEPDRLLVLDGPDQGLWVRLDAGPVLVGVGEGVTIRLPEDAAPPGVYALVRPLPQGRYEIVRRGATMGLRVRRQPAERALLDDEDVMRFDAPDGTEVVSVRFLAARRVRHHTLTPPAPVAGLGQGWRLDAATLPKREAIEAALDALPLWWRLEGESVWPRPEGYRAPPLRFTDVTNEPPPEPRPEAVNEPASPRERRRRMPRWALAAAMLVLVGGSWALGRRWADPDPVADGAGQAAGAASTPLVITAAPLATGAANAAGVSSVAPETAGREGASPAAALAEPPGANLPGTPKAHSNTSSRAIAPTRRAASSGSSDDAPERRRELCRVYAAQIARGETLPETTQFYRARCL